MKRQYVFIMITAIAFFSGCSRGMSRGGSSTITEAEAKTIAFAHANVQEKDTNFLRCQLDYDDGRQFYDVEFFKDGKEFDYEIDAITGDIVGYDSDAEHYTPSVQTEPAPSQPKTPPTQTEISPAQTDTAPTQSGTEATISESDAQNIALSHAGMSMQDVTGFRCHLDRDDGRIVYEIEFRQGFTEYDYEVDAQSGNILKSNKEIDD